MQEHRDKEPRGPHVAGLGDHEVLARSDRVVEVGDQLVLVRIGEEGDLARLFARVVGKPVDVQVVEEIRLAHLPLRRREARVAVRLTDDGLAKSDIRGHSLRHEMVVRGVDQTVSESSSTSYGQ